MLYRLCGQIQCLEPTMSNLNHSLAVSHFNGNSGSYHVILCVIHPYIRITVIHAICYNRLNQKKNREKLLISQE